jgi:hypothetical protein
MDREQDEVRRASERGGRARERARSGRLGGPLGRNGESLISSAAIGRNEAHAKAPSSATTAIPTVLRRRYMRMRSAPRAKAVVSVRGA